MTAIIQEQDKGLFCQTLVNMNMKVTIFKRQIYLYLSEAFTLEITVLLMLNA